jgi:transposase
VIAITSRDLTDAPGAVLAPYFASPLPRPDGRGRPWQEARQLLHGVLFILRTGCAWADLPRSYAPRSTGHDRFQTWIESGVFAAARNELASNLEANGWIDRRECFIDGTFAPAKRGGAGVGQTKKGPASKSMAVVEAEGLPVAMTIDSAHPHEVKLLEPRLKARLVDSLPERRIGDKADDSEALDARWAAHGMEVIAPPRSNRKNKTQDGRPLRRQKRRWQGERFLGWLQAFRRVLVRGEVQAQNYLGFVQLACVLILLRRTV